MAQHQAEQMALVRDRTPAPQPKLSSLYVCASCGNQGPAEPSRDGNGPGETSGDSAQPRTPHVPTRRRRHPWAVLSFRYAVFGAAIATGAPFGLLLVRAISDGVTPSLPWLAQQVALEPLLYGYITVSTFLVLALTGMVLGRHEDHLVEQASTDPLTGLLNRRQLARVLTREHSRAGRYHRDLALLLLDVDNFKAVNDRHGHVGGDRALQVIARELIKRCRASDYAVRQGGDEFCLVLPDTSAMEAQTLAARLASSLRQAAPYAAGSDAITLSVGIAQLKAHESSDSLWQRADRAVYEAKDAGRDRVMLAG